MFARQNAVGQIDAQAGPQTPTASSIYWPPICPLRVGLPVRRRRRIVRLPRLARANSAPAWGRRRWRRRFGRRARALPAAGVAGIRRRPGRWVAAPVDHQGPARIDQIRVWDPVPLLQLPHRHPVARRNARQRVAAAYAVVYGCTACRRGIGRRQLRGGSCGRHQAKAQHHHNEEDRAETAPERGTHKSLLSKTSVSYRRELESGHNDQVVAQQHMDNTRRQRIVGIPLPTPTHRSSRTRPVSQGTPCPSSPKQHVTLAALFGQRNTIVARFVLRVKPSREHFVPEMINFLHYRIPRGRSLCSAGRLHV